MTRLLVVGGAGMLGHKLWQHACDRFDTSVTLHGPRAEYERLGLFAPERTFDSVDVAAIPSVARVVDAVRPDVVVNCAGIIKQRAAAKDAIASLAVNALFPHRLAELCDRAGARLIHVSTDCVFSGSRGMYREDDRSDADDLYGRTKLLGEVGAPHLTIRTSMIGRELRNSTGLVEWFLAQRGRPVTGYAGAIFSGFTTLALARIIGDVIDRHRALAGLYHVSANPITKLDLLTRLRDRLGLDVEIQCATEPRIDRSLDGSLFRTATGFEPPSWDDMIAGLAADPTRYDDWRRQ